MKKKIIIAVLVIAAIAGVMKYRSHSAGGEPDAIWVEASAAKEVSLPQEVHAIGTLVAQSVEITPEVAGHVKKVSFQDGTFVKKGTVLIQLDDAVSRAQFESAKAQYIFSERNYHRYVLLGKQGAVSKVAIDQAEADFKEKKAAADEKEVMLNKMQLVAPFDGMVGKSKVGEGDYVTVAEGLVTLTETKHLHIEYSVPEQNYSAIKLGQAVTVSTAAYPNKTFTGKIAYISPTINTDNRSVAIYAEVPNDANVLAAGMFVNITQALGAPTKTLMIPARSLVPILDGEQVYKVIDGKAVAAPVKIGQRTEDNVQIIEGLKLGDIIITDGQLKVRNHMPVKIKS